MCFFIFFYWRFGDIRAEKVRLIFFVFGEVFGKVIFGVICLLVFFLLVSFLYFFVFRMFSFFCGGVFVGCKVKVMVRFLESYV